MIEIKALYKTFGKRNIFENLTLNFEDGKIYALIGESGSGKTTLLNILAKLEPFDQGEILYKGKNIKQVSDLSFYRNELGYLFQNYGLIDNDTVGQNLDLGLVGKGVKSKEAVVLKREALKRVQLDHMSLDRPIYELSGGECQRVALAKLILKDPPLILADEPTASLDPENADQVMELLLSLKKSNRIIIIATHNPTIWSVVDEVINLDRL